MGLVIQLSFYRSLIWFPPSESQRNFQVFQKTTTFLGAELFVIKQYKFHCFFSFANVEVIIFQCDHIRPIYEAAFSWVGDHNIRLFWLFNKTSTWHNSMHSFFLRSCLKKPLFPSFPDGLRLIDKIAVRSSWKSVLTPFDTGRYSSSVQTYNT